MNSLFELRAEEEGLSVFDSSVVKEPDDALRHMIDSWKRQKLQKNLARYGETVESVREAGWGVVALKAEYFLRNGFTLGEPDATGHLEVKGEPLHFKRFAPEFAEECVKA